MEPAMKFFFKPFFLLVLITLVAWCKAEGQGTALRGDGMNFIENKGQLVDMHEQLRPDILFTGDGAGAKVYLRKIGVSYVMTKYEGLQEGDENPAHLLNATDPIQENDVTVKMHRIDMDFIGCNSNAAVLKQQAVEGYNNYYYAQCQNGITNVKGYNKVVYQNMYNNIDVVYYGSKEKGVKYDIIVKPGGDANNIKIEYSGAESIELEGRTLKVESSLGTITESIPRVYQNINGEIVDVKAEYVLNGTVLNFRLSDFSTNYPLIIDPAANWITYYGGSDIDQSNRIVNDQSGNVLVTGKTTTLNFPVSVGAFQTTLGNTARTWDAFVLKFNSTGSRLWATYYGGDHRDISNGIISDGNGNVIIAGLTSSSTFPVSSGAFQGSFNPLSKVSLAQDAFVVKFDVNGIRLWATYYGGNGEDAANGIATDVSGNVIIAGDTRSSDLAVTAGAFQGSLNIAGVPYKRHDAFVAKFDANGNRLWASYYGGDDMDFGNGVATNVNADIIITGETKSANFSVSAGAAQGSLNPAGAPVQDAFIIKFDASGNRLWATYFGGDGYDTGHDIALDSGSNIVITGETSSTVFPVTPGCNQPSFGGGVDIFIAKFNSGGALLWATYQGISYQDYVPSCAIDQNDNIYILAEMEDITTGTLPVYSCVFQNNFGGGTEDQDITKYDKSGKHLCTTYMGGSSEDDLDGAKGGIACYGNFIYFSSNTKGSGYPVTSNAFQQNFAGVWNVTVGRICSSNCGVNDLQPKFSFTQVNVACAVLATIDNQTSSCSLNETTWQWSFPGGTPAISTNQHPGNINYSANGTYPITLVIVTPCGNDTLIQTITINTGIGASVTGDSTICSGQSVTLSTSNALTCLWSPATYLNDSTLSQVVASPTVTTTYIASGTSANGCTYSFPVTVTVKNAPVYDIAVNGTCSEMTLSVNDSATSYLWNTGETNPVILANQPGKYWIAITTAGCISEDTVDITEEQMSFSTIFFPNSFTPNGDGLNDIFQPTGEGIAEFNLKIFDRWGELIYETNDFGKGWDGNYLDQLVKMDIYIYQAKIKMECGDEIIKSTGHVWVGK